MLNVVVLLAVLASSCGSPPAVPDSFRHPTPKAETLALEPADAHYGIVFTGDRVDRRHRIINRGDQPVTLLKLKVSASGSFPHLPRYGQVLQPGESTFVDFWLHGGSRPHKLTLSFQLLASGRENPKPDRTRVQAISISAVEVEPALLPDRRPARVTLRSIDGQPFSIKSWYPETAIRLLETISPSEIVVEATVVAPQRTILLRLDHPHGELLGRIRLAHEDGSDSRPAPFALDGKLRARPTVVEACFLDVGEELIVYAGIFNGTKEPVLAAAAPELQIPRDIEIKPGAFLPYAITLRGDEPGELSVRHTVRVGDQEIELHAHATVVDVPDVIEVPPPPPAAVPVQTPEGP